jgi:ABC-2 type transport system permease protein
MNHHLRLIPLFIRASIQQETAYRANFFIGLLHSLLNFGTGVLGLSVIFEQVDTVRGWDFSATLAVLGIYLTVNALRDLFIGPSLNGLAGMDGDVWTGKLDFTMLRPVDVQFWASLRQWRLFSLFDLMLGFGVIVAAVTQFESAPSLANLLTFLILLIAGVIVIYAILLVFTALVFWSPGFLFTWVFDGIFQLARYPVGLYPGWLRLALTWVIPVGLVTTIPAQALTGDLQIGMLIGSLMLSAALFAGASILFHRGMRRYASASS